MFKIREMPFSRQPSSDGGEAKAISEGQIIEEGEKKFYHHDQYEEKIENGIWIPSVFEKYIKKGVLGAGATTKKLKEIINKKEAKIRITADPHRFDQKFFEESEEIRIAKLGAGRILKEFLKRIAPKVDVHNIEKSRLEHGDKVTVVDIEYLRKAKKERAKVLADGMVTNLKEIPLMVTAADCAPVGIYDPENHAIGVFHSGWRGTAKQISRKGVKRMQETYNSKPDQLIVAIGPYANGEKFEVDEKVYKEFREVLLEGSGAYSQKEINTFFKENEKKKGHYFLDIGKAIKLSLIKAGILEENIQVSKYSTIDKEGNSLFSSERVEGRQARDAFVFAMVLRNRH